MIINPQVPLFIGASYTRNALMPGLSLFPAGKTSVEPLRSKAKELGVPVAVVVTHDLMRGDALAEVHRGAADLWICMEGTLSFLVGGALIDPFILKDGDGAVDENEIRAHSIENAVTYPVSQHDLLYIPAGLPHLHWTDHGFARLLVVKIAAPVLFPLELVPGWKSK